MPNKENPRLSGRKQNYILKVLGADGQYKPISAQELEAAVREYPVLNEIMQN